jgi:hypothetical protein
MSTAASPLRRHAKKWAIAGAIALAVIVPTAIAFAASTASFSSRTPASGSSSYAAQPTVSVIVYDVNGVHGAGTITMTFDSQSVVPGVTYIVAGSFNPKTGYRRFKVSYRPPSALSVGRHTVAIRVKDLKGKVSTSSWYFTVLPPYQAQFSSATPATSAFVGPNPTVSVVVYDKYGISGSTAYRSMTIDGVLKPTTMTRLSGTTKSRLSYAVPASAPLTNGPHTVAVMVKDAQGHSFLYTWTINVDTAPPVTTMAGGFPIYYTGLTDRIQLSATDSGSGVAHTYYILDNGPLTEGTSVFAVFGLGSHTLTYWSVDKLGNVEARNTATSTVTALHSLLSQYQSLDCFAAGCHVDHDNTTTTPSVTAIHAAVPGRHDNGCGICHSGVGIPTADCATIGCHSPTDAYPVADPHSAHHPSIMSTLTVPSGCTRDTCHGTTLVSSYTHPTCQTCHNSTDPVVQAAIAAGIATGTPTAATCETCHLHMNGGATPSYTAIHASGDASHAVSGSCFSAGCHSADVSVTHTQGDNPPGCTACHPNATHTTAGPPSTNCDQCHTGIAAIHSFTHANAAGTQSSTCVSCHGSDLPTVHASLGCFCHSDPSLAATMATLIASGQAQCTDCHNTVHDLVGAHASTIGSTSATITIAGVGYVEPCSMCHAVSDLRTIHGNNCDACHLTDVDATLGGAWQKGCAQGNCHAGTSPIPMHGNVTAAHATSSSVTASCGGSGCHGTVTDAAAIHAAHGGCADCHANPDHAASLVCSTCHPDTPHNLVTAHAATLTTVDITINGNDYGLYACSTCHTSADLRTLHGGDTGCANCHPNPADQVMGTWNGTCTQGGCHSADSTMTVAQHANVDSAHDTPSSVTTSCGSVNGASCHGDVSDVAVIHANHGGCADCHANPNHAASLVCSTCHPDTPHNLVTAHAATLTTVDITINGTDYGPMPCSTCHTSNDLPTIHNGACTDCHTTPADTTPVDSVLGGTWNKGCVQGGCHGTTATMPYHGGGNLGVDAAHDTPSSVTTACGGSVCHGTVTDAAAIHAAHGGCADCHANPNHPASLVCTTCHPDTPHDQTAAHASTIGSASATITINNIDYGPVACSMCHAPVNGAEDLRTIHRQGQNGNCGWCHLTDVETTLGGPWQKGCVQGGCHSLSSIDPIHASVSTMHDTPSSVTTSCGGPTCHGDVSDVAVIHAAHGGCADCHANPDHAASLVCSTCHTDTPHDLVTAHAATLTTVDITIDGTDYGPIACSTCHTSNDLPTIHGGCTDCHTMPSGTPGVDTLLTTTPWNGACVQSGCHDATSTMPYHGGSSAGLDAAHATPSSVTTSCGSANGASCHGDVSNVAAIHASHGGCADCHANPNHAASLVCSTCHTDTPHDVPGAHNANLPSGGMTITINGNAYSTTGCGECHRSSNLLSIHNNTCTDCHTTPADATPVDTVLGGTWDKSCTQGGCHDTTATMPYHGNGGTASIGTAHDTPSSVTTSCGGSTCHGDVTDVAVIHASHGGCADCHGISAPHAASLVCSDCHTDTPHNLGTAHAATIGSTNITITVDGTGYGFTCSDCHASSDLPTIHNGACIDCHTSPAGSPSVDTVLGGAWAHGCVQGGCHDATSTMPFHGGGGASLDVTHESTSGCIAVGCHTGDVALIHETQLAGGPTPPGCVACHGVGKTPSTNCADCHTSPAPHDLVALHAAAALPSGNITFTVDGTAYGTTGCSECHASTDLRTLHGGDAGCTNCHPNPANQILGTWDHTCTQGGCHSVTSTMTVAEHGTTVTTSHNTTPGLQASCGTTNGSTCHANITNVAAIHAVQMPGDPTPAPGCAACHGAIAPAPASFVCSDCHTLHDLTALHAALLPLGDATMTINGNAYGTTGCTQCHAMPADLRTLHGGDCATCHNTSAATLATWNNTTCGQTIHACHSVNSTTTIAYHGTSGSILDATHTADATGCAGLPGCHSTDVAVIHTTSVPGGPATPPGCGACHATGVTPSTDCADCHTSPAPHDLVALHAATIATTAITITAGGASVSFTCSDCHTSSDLRDIHNQDCATCHTENVDTTLGGAWAHGCAQGNCHEGTATLQYHGTSVTNAHGVDPSGCSQGGCHSTDVAEIHNAPGGPGCAACHTNGKTPSLDCGVCHTEYPTLPDTVHTSHISTDLAGDISIDGNTYTGMSCASCHGNSGTGNTQIDLQQIPGHDGLCSTCHPTPAGSVTKGDFTCNQVGCHGTGTLQGAALVQHANLNPAHSVAATSCTQAGCHAGAYNGGSDVAKIHSVVTGHGPNGCGVCHDGTLVSAPTLSCGGSSNCHPGYPTMSTSHSSHISTEVAGDMVINDTDYGNHTCADCHGNAGTNNSLIDLQKIPGHPTVYPSGCADCHASATQSATTGDFTCTAPACHGTGTLTSPAIRQHINITSAHLTTAGVSASCGTANGSSCHANLSDVAKIHNAVTGHGPNGCGVCHDGTLVTAPTLSCGGSANCHPGYPTPSAAHNPGSHVTAASAISISINGVSYGSHNCSECHASQDLQQIAAHGSSPDCATCHPGPADGAAKGVFTCNQSGCHATSGSHTGDAIGQHVNAGSDHNVSAASYCTGSGCHTGASSVDVAAIHAAVPGRTDHGCGICHSPGSTPISTCATPGCHGGGDPYPYATVNVVATAHPQMATLHLQTANDQCYTCHGYNYDGCQDCHGDYGDPGTLSTDDLSAIHAAHGYNCWSCHSNGQVLSDDSSTCGSCHDLNDMNSYNWMY